MTQTRSCLHVSENQLSDDPGSPGDHRPAAGAAIDCSPPVNVDKPSTQRDSPTITNEVGPIGNPGVEEIVIRQTAVRTEPATQTPCDLLPDGNLLGNGDVGVVVAGDAVKQEFFIAKNDFWAPSGNFGYLEGSGLGQQAYPIGGVSLVIPELKGASFRQEMDFYRAESRSEFSRDDLAVRVCARVPATGNLLLIELTNSGAKSVSVQVDTWTRSNSQRHVWIRPDSQQNSSNPDDGMKIPNSSRAGVDGAVAWITRDSATRPDDLWRAHAAIATRVLGAQSATALRDSLKAGSDFQLEPGQRVVVVSQIGNAVWFAPDFKLTKIKELVVQGAESLSETKQRCEQWKLSDIEPLVRGHQAWWEAYWRKAWIELPGEPALERFFYGSVYLMGAGARAGKVAPGLYGPWTTADNPAWSADYHLNYNHQHPWYGVYAINRPELAIPYFDSIVNLLPLGREKARELKQEGVIFLTGAGPYGWAHRNHHGMPNNVESTINFRDYYLFTQDMDFLRNVAYPFMKEVDLNWDATLIKEPGASGDVADYRYKIHLAWDEGGRKVNNPTSALAFIRALYSFLVQAADDLGSDAELLPRWRDIAEHLSDYATMEYKGRTIFDFAEAANAPEGNPYPYTTYPFYPAATEGPDSKYRQILVNTLSTRPSYWMQPNAFTQVFAAGALGGYPTDELIGQLRRRIEVEIAANGIVRVPEHSTLENAFSVNNVVLLLLQSGVGCIRVFPVWDFKKNASFVNLRAQGAFLVSSAVADGVVQYLTITSEKGGRVTVSNPWPGRDLVVESDHDENVILEKSNDRYTFSTREGASYRFSFARDKAKE